MKINLIRFSNSLDPNATYKADSEAFLKDINDELFEDDYELVEGASDASMSIVFIETGGSEQKFVLEADKLPRPIILLSNCKNNSLPACFEIKTYLESRNEQCLLLFGEEKQIANTIKRVSSLVNCTTKFSSYHLGVIGEPSNWLIASRVDYQEVKRIFGIELIDYTTEELAGEINKGILEDIPHLERLKQLETNEEVLNGALAIYSGLKRMIKKHNLDGFTLRCFDLIEQYKNTACLAFALLNEEGYLAACEGDVPALLTMALIKEVTNKPSFQANPSKIDLKNEEMLFAHCTLPLNMCRDYSLMTHFESGLGIGVRGTLDTSECTIVKIAPNLKHILCVRGEIKENLTLPNYCRTQILVKPEPEGLFDFLNEAFGNHVLIAYGNIASEVLTTFHYLIDKAKVEEK